MKYNPPRKGICVKGIGGSRNKNERKKHIAYLFGIIIQQNKNNARIL